MIIRAEGGIHGNSLSGHLQRHDLTDTISGILTNLQLVLTRIEGKEGKTFHYSKQSGHAVGQQERNTKHENSLLKSGSLPSLRDLVD